MPIAQRRRPHRPPRRGFRRPGYTRGLEMDCPVLASERSALRAEFAAFNPARSVDSRRLIILSPFGSVKRRMTGGLLLTAIQVSLDHESTRRMHSGQHSGPRLEVGVP